MRGNPLREFMDDEMFSRLWDRGFLNERMVRDFYIRETFSMRKDGEKAGAIITELQREFPYLSVETVRKIVYSREPEYAAENY